MKSIPAKCAQSWHEWEPSKLFFSEQLWIDVMIAVSCTYMGSLFSSTTTNICLIHSKTSSTPIIKPLPACTWHRVLQILKLWLLFLEGVWVFVRASYIFLVYIFLYSLMFLISCGYHCCLTAWGWLRVWFRPGAFRVLLCLCGLISWWETVGVRVSVDGCGDKLAAFLGGGWGEGYPAFDLRQLGKAAAPLQPGVQDKWWQKTDRWITLDFGNQHTKRWITSSLD